MDDSQPALPVGHPYAPAPDPEIFALLDFEPVPRKVEVEGGWTPDLQREFIARLAVHGSATKACDEMGKNRTGISKLYRSPQGASFRKAWDGAVELATRRMITRGPAVEYVSVGTKAPTLDYRRKQPVQVANEFGEQEDEASYQRRGEEAGESIKLKLLRARRLFLAEISECPGKRAAFEILTELPIDWEKAKELEPQPDEPYNPVRMRKADMVLTAESGWMFGEIGYGPDKKAELMKAVDAYRAEQGLPPTNWEGDADGE